MQYKISVIGCGAWGSTIADLLADNGYSVVLFAREEEVVNSINNDNKNTLFLPNVKLNNNIVAKPFDKIKNDLTEYVVWAVPVVYSHDVLETYKEELADKHILIASKGINYDYKKFVYEIINEQISSYLSVISGPTFAYEVATKKPTAVSIASKSINIAKIWQKYLSNDYFRVYTTTDIIGVCVGGALKNVVAIATGISDGLKLGLNARSALITRGLTEIARLGLKMGGKLETFMGLSGLGDLVLTCTGDLSRNRWVGKCLGEGKKLDEIINNMKSVAEGIYTVKAAKYMQILYDVEMPITDEVYRILYENKNIYEAIIDLMNRPLKSEGL
ncbi:MAG: NAD(P)H-dependent glycerol-3-phosphate dehydrogenase [Deferribacterota bacterium]|nr:NAD(P)H-dependent glycerol-3-phosphate dehydrogenase [Deferribacterota bacterium]